MCCLVRFNWKVALVWPATPKIKMSENVMIEGVGDEVVLFGGFLVLSVACLALISIWQRGRTPEAAGQAQEPDPGRGRSSEGDNSTPQSQPNEEVLDADVGLAVGARTELPDGLRHRSRVTPAASAHSTAATTSAEEQQSRSVSRDTLREEEDGGRVSPHGDPTSNNSSSAGEEDSDISVRLIQAGGKVQEIRINPGATLGDLRR